MGQSTNTQGTSNEPGDYQRFEDLTKKLLTVKKTELDRARAVEKAKK